MTTNEAAKSLALSKIAAAPNARALLTPGQYDIDTTINVSGHLRVGADYDVAPTVSIPMLETLALFIHYSGITGPHAAAKLVQAMQDSLKIDGTGQGAILATVPIIKQSEEFVRKQIISQLPRQPRKGAVTQYLNVKEIVTA